MLKQQLLDMINQIVPINEQVVKAVFERWDHIAKPLDALGVMEDLIAKIGGIQGQMSPDITKKCIAVMCADNGVVKEGVTQTTSDVTAVIASNMLKKQTSVTLMAEAAHCDVRVYDVGMLTEIEGIENRKVKSGTADFYIESAMNYDDALTMILTGISIVKELKEAGYSMIGAGETGIGNTTTSSAVAASLLSLPAAQVTGKGAGLSDDGLKRKIEVIESAIRMLRPDRSDPVDVLAKVGGFDIAAMCGLFLGGACYHVPIVIDGLISSVAALCSYRLCPFSNGYMIPSHCSKEPAAMMIMEELKLQPVIMANMALGEGTGAVTMMPLLDMILHVYQQMPTFKETKIEEYKPL
ncbi:MAG: nicotinate-nucleotide--dimethylbenzimidazole phosphoribosyltransferase [Clostridia bacterium]|nr:nicotinate-nucleotide--dimethylbenzimidazole phosphoribosyltransferase [Clostridia bacterium]